MENKNIVELGIGIIIALVAVIYRIVAAKVKENKDSDKRQDNELDDIRLDINDIKHTIKKKDHDNL